MCHAPWEILGGYNQLDSAATWELYKLFKDVVNEYEETWGSHYWPYIEQDYMTHLLLQIESYGRGLYLNLENLKKYKGVLEREINEYRNRFMAEPRVAKYIQEYNKEQAKYIVNKHKQYTKNGKVNQNWQKFEDKKQAKIDEVQFNVDSTNQIRWLVSKVFDITRHGNVYKVYHKEGDNGES